MEGMPTIDIDRDRAREELALFRKITKEKRSQEDKAFMAAYRAAAKGQQLLSLSQVMKWAGTDEETELPKMAIARADAQVVHYRHAPFSNAAPEYTTLERPRWGRTGDLVPCWDRGGYRQRHRFDALAPEWPETPRDEWYTTAVPIIPPAFRPPWKLSNYHILFEVKSWDQTEEGDPLLLRHLHDDLFAVLAAWDITALEAAILNGRFA